MKRLLLLLAIIPVLSYSQVTAIVNQYGGVNVYVYCSPLTEYEVLGKVDFAYTPTTTTTVVNMNGVMIPIASESKPTYSQLRDGLVSQSVMANRDVEGIIIDGSSATMIRYKDPTAENRLAKVDREEGLYVFVDCKPTSDYDYIIKLSPKGFYACSCSSLIQNTQKKHKKKLAGKVYNAAIISLSSPFAYVEYINIK